MSELHQLLVRASNDMSAATFTIDEVMVQESARLRHRRTVLVGGLVVAALALAAGVTLAVATPPAAIKHNTHHPVASPTNAVALLGRVSLAADNNSTTPRDDQFSYANSEVAYTVTTAQSSGPVNDPAHPLKMVTAVTPVHQLQTWNSIDGQRPGLSREQVATPARGGDRVLPANSYPTLYTPTYDYLDTLPTDPDRLLAAVQATIRANPTDPKAAGRTADSRAFALLGQLLEQPMLPPKLAMALYRTAAKIPGITLASSVADIAGRHGIAVSRVAAAPGLSSNGTWADSQQIQEMWIFDSQTYQYLGQRQTNLSDGIIQHASAIMARAVVDKIGDLPN